MDSTLEDLTNYEFKTFIVQTPGGIRINDLMFVCSQVVLSTAAWKSLSETLGEIFVRYKFIANENISS